jgi:glycerate-2-kinase
MKKIRNRALLYKNKLRGDALSIIEAGLSAIDTKEAIKNNVSLRDGTLCIKDKEFPLADVKRIFVVGVGKCSVTAAAQLERVLRNRITAGMVIDVRDPAVGELSKIKAYKGTHPMPTEANVDAAKALVDLLSKSEKGDLVLCIISGGGSTLLCLPEEGTRCIEEEMILKELFRKGATIQEINTIRKHMSLVRGGFLAKHAYPAQTVSLIFSDVPGNDISYIASGPTVKDTTTIADADRILAKFSILMTCGLDHCGLIETPKEDKYFEAVTNILFISNVVALEAMQEEASKLGYHSTIVNSKIIGEAREVGKDISLEISRAPSKTALLYGGETTVTMKGKGMGGRNQELVLGALSSVDEDTLVASTASDGRDNTDHAGALCDILTAQKVKQQGIDIREYLDKNNSFGFFEKIGDFISTGNTGSNVSDIIIALKQ